MSKGVELFIGGRQFLLCGGSQSNDAVKVGVTLDEFSQEFANFSTQGAAKKQYPLTIFVHDALLYFTKINLPKQTPDVEKAIALQLDMLSPFGEDCLYASDIQFGKESIVVLLYFVDKNVVLPILEIIVRLGWHIQGLYPVSQRAMNKENRKKTWGLLSTGLFSKLTIFTAGNVYNRVVLPGEPEREVLRKSYELDLIQDVSEIMVHSALPATVFKYDLLPQPFRQIDYLKWGLIFLVGLNLFFGLAWVSMNFINLQSEINTVTVQQEDLDSHLQEFKKLQRQHSNQLQKLKEYEVVVKNKNLIDLLAMLTQNLPKSCYLDQFRLDKKTGAIHIQGYTTQLSELTESLQIIGHATLESTRKRKGQTYFQIEVLPE